MNATTTPLSKVDVLDVHCTARFILTFVYQLLPQLTELANQNSCRIDLITELTLQKIIDFRGKLYLAPLTTVGAAAAGA